MPLTLPFWIGVSSLTPKSLRLASAYFAVPSAIPQILSRSNWLIRNDLPCLPQVPFHRAWGNCEDCITARFFPLYPTRYPPLGGQGSGGFLCTLDCLPQFPQAL